MSQHSATADVPAFELLLLEYRVRDGLPTMQGVCVGLLCLSEEPCSYRAVADALGLSRSTVMTHMSRVRTNHQDLYAAVMGQRRRMFAARHEAVVERRRLRSLRWGRRRYAAGYRKAHGRWPWEDFAGAGNWVTPDRLGHSG
jgi:hypothetical protein